MRLYTGIDLPHSATVISRSSTEPANVFKKKGTNDPEQILSALTPYKDSVVGIVVESMYNWYWLMSRPKAVALRD